MTNCPFSVPVPRHRASAPRLSGRPDSRCYTARTPSASGAQSTASPPALGCPTRTKFSHGRTPAVVGRPTRARPPRTAAAPSSASQANRGRPLPPGSSAGRWQRPSSRCGAFLEPLAVAVAANHQTRPRCLSSPITPTLSPRTSPARSSTRPTPCAGRRAARDQRRSAGACMERRAPWAEAPHQPARFAAAGRISSHHSPARSRLERSKRIGRNGARSRRIDGQSLVSRDARGPSRIAVVRPLPEITLPFRACSCFTNPIPASLCTSSRWHPKCSLVLPWGGPPMLAGVSRSTPRCVLRPARFPTTDPGRSFFFAVPRGHP